MSKMITKQKFRNRPSQSWLEWFAGLVDADGCLLLNPKGYTSLEITMDIYDKYPLQQIKQYFGGSIKLRSNARAFRYRLPHKDGMLIILDLLNGNIQNSVRSKQLTRLCNHFNIDLLKPVNLNINNGWFAGFFDGDGTISYSFKKGYP